MRASPLPFIALLGVLASAACSSGGNRPTPGVSSEVFDGPGDRLTAAERDALQKAYDGIKGQVVRCIELGYDHGVRASEIKARIRFRQDGHIYAVGFKSSPANEDVANFLGCVRAAFADMNLKGGPWKADRNVVYGLNTGVDTTWD